MCRYPELRLGISLNNPQKLDLINYAAIELLEKLKIIDPRQPQIELIEKFLNTIINNNASDIANLCRKLSKNSIELKLTTKQVEKYVKRTLPTSQYPDQSKKLSIVNMPC